MPADPRPAGARWGGPGDSGGRAPGACSAMHAGCAAAHTHVAASLLAAAPALADTSPFDAPTSANGALTARMIPQTARPSAGAHVPTPFPLAHSLSIFSSRAPRPPPAPAAGASPALVQPPSAAAAPGAAPRPRSNLGAPSPHAAATGGRRCRPFMQRGRRRAAPLSGLAGNRLAESQWRGPLAYASASGASHPWAASSVSAWWRQRAARRASWRCTHVCFQRRAAGAAGCRTLALRGEPCARVRRAGGERPRSAAAPAPSPPPRAGPRAPWASAAGASSPEQQPCARGGRPGLERSRSLSGGAAWRSNPLADAAGAPAAWLWSAPRRARGPLHGRHGGQRPPLACQAADTRAFEAATSAADCRQPTSGAGRMLQFCSKAGLVSPGVAAVQAPAADRIRLQQRRQPWARGMQVRRTQSTEHVAGTLSCAPGTMQLHCPFRRWGFRASRAPPAARSGLASRMRCVLPASGSSAMIHPCALRACP